jgi:hypothetical protein
LVQFQTFRAPTISHDDDQPMANELSHGEVGRAGSVKTTS